MDKSTKKLLCAVLAVLALTVSLTACGKKEKDDLPPVVTHVIPENEKKKSSIVTDDFTIDIYSSYSAVTAYSGNKTEVTIPESAAGVKVRVLGESIFKDNSVIKKVVLPSGLYMIDRYAFENSAVREVVFNDGLETVGDYAFRNSALTVLDLPDSVSTLGKYAFYGTKITSVKIPGGVSRAGKYCFYGCTELKTVEFCPRMVEIAENMFYNCTALTEIVIPENVTKICNYAFSTCTALTSITVPEETVNFGEGVFFGCDALTVHAPAGSQAAKFCRYNNVKFEEFAVPAED